MGQVEDIETVEGLERERGWDLGAVCPLDGRLSGLFVWIPSQCLVVHVHLYCQYLV